MSFLKRLFPAQPSVQADEPQPVSAPQPEDAQAAGNATAETADAGTETTGEPAVSPAVAAADDAVSQPVAEAEPSDAADQAGAADEPEAPVAVKEAAAEADSPAPAETDDVSPSEPEAEAVPRRLIDTAELPELDEEVVADEVLLKSTVERPGKPADIEITVEEVHVTPNATAPLPSTGELFSALADGVTRPLPPEALLEFTPLTHLVFGQATDIGRMRSNNQDSVYSFFATGRSADELPDFGLFIVADGMGGHQDGEKASAITARTVAAEVLDTMYYPLITRRGVSAETPISETLVVAIQKANSEIMASVPDGGTTLSTVVIIGDRAYIAHVGDSRVYMYSRGSLEKLTRDHSLVQRLIELDQITPDEASEHPQKNVLYRALGQNQQVEVDTLTKRLPAGANLLLCSDGLWNQVTDAEIAEIVSRYRNPQEACQKLISLANARGGADNVTLIILQMPG